MCQKPVNSATPRRWTHACGGAAMGLMLVGCAGPTDGRWVGSVTPDGPGCTASRGVMVLRGGSFVFAPSEGVVVLHGTVSPSGDLLGTLQVEGANHQPVIWRFRGTRTGRGVTGVLEQPGCSARVALQPG